MNVTKTIMSLYEGEMNRALICSSKPNSIPAKNAPGIEPSPPTTTTIKARKPKLAPAVGKIE